MRGGDIIAKRKTAREAVRRFAKSVDYPEDALFDTASIRIIGRGELTVEGCRGVLLCAASRICLDMGDFVATVYGSNMTIDELSLAQLCITADVTALALDPKGDGE